MKYDFAALGGTTYDISFISEEGLVIDNHKDLLRQELLAFENGAKIKVEEFYKTFGGGGANTAVNLANFGFKTACVSAVGGDDYGKLILANLKKRGVIASAVEILSKSDSGFSFILINKGERIIFTQRGANSSFNLSLKQERILKSVKNIYISSLSGKWQANLKKVFKIAKSSQAKVYWNPSQSQYQGGYSQLKPFLKNTFVFALNKDEAIELALLSSEKNKKKSKIFLNKEENLLKIIKDLGPEIVLITSGKQGAYAYDGEQIYFQPILKEKKRVDMTGVGDAFNSTFAAGMEIYQGDIKKAMHLAAKNAASKIAHFGAQNGLIKWNKKV